MTFMRWLALIDPLPRRLLLGLTVGSLVVGSLLLEQLDQSVWVLDLVALGWLGGLALLWAGMRWRAQPRVRARRLKEEAELRDQLHDRGLLVGGAVTDHRGGLGRLAQIDPDLCLPALLEWAWLLYDASREGRAVPWVDTPAPIPLGEPLLAEMVAVGVTRSRDRVRVEVALTTGAADGTRSTVGLVLERPATARSVPPEDLTHLDRADRADDWHLVSVRPRPAEPAPSKPKPGLDSARRALKARHDLDLTAIEQRVSTMAEELSAGKLERLASRCTPLGELALEAPRTLTEEPPTWIDVSTDGAYDLVEMRCRGAVFSLCRPSDSDGEWLLWRVRGGVS